MGSDVKAPPGSAGRKRRAGGHRNRGTMLRFSPDVAAALEGDARKTGDSKVMIVERLLRQHYGLT